MRKTFSRTFLIFFAFEHIKRTGQYVRKTVREIKKREEKVAIPVEEEQPQEENNLDIAAIAMALYLHFDDQHEVEQTGFWLNRPLNQQTTWTAKNILFKKSPVRKYIV